MSLRSALVLALALCAPAGCGESEAPLGDLGAGSDLARAGDLGAVTDGGGGVQALVPLRSGRTNVDILFMIDNSPSMAPKQAELRARFPSLLKALDTAAQAGRPGSYHIGVVTSDLGAGQFVLGGQCHPGGDGAKLQALGKAAPASCMAPTGAVNFLEVDYTTGAATPTTNAPAGQDVNTTFGCMAAVGDTGCGFESQLESVYKALHDPITENAGFLRDDAALVVLLLTDEDDCSADANSDLFDPSKSQAPPMGYGALDSYRCTEFGIECVNPSDGKLAMLPYGDSGGAWSQCRSAPASDGGKLLAVQKYIDFFTKPKAQGGVKLNPDDVVLSAIIGPAMPVQSLLAKPTAGPYTACSPLSPPSCVPVLQHSCIASTNTQFFADPAVRIHQVVSAVAVHEETSTCDTSYDVALSNLGTLVQPTTGATGCLPSPPADSAAPSCVVTANGNPLPACSAANAPPCWHVDQTTLCASGAQLVIDQPPIDATLSATCVVTP